MESKRIQRKGRQTGGKKAKPVYHSIVKQRVRSIFAQNSAGNAQAMLDALAKTFTYRFVGETPLGGTRTSSETMARWWDRLYRLFPGAQFDPVHIISEGWPWDTRVMTYVVISGSIPQESGSGSRPYENEFMQFMRLRWGKITEIITIEDTLRFHEILPTLARAGINDATAGPLEDEIERN